MASDQCTVEWNPGVWPYVTRCAKKVPHVKRGDDIHEDRQGRTISHNSTPDVVADIQDRVRRLRTIPGSLLDSAKHMDECDD